MKKILLIILVCCPLYPMEKKQGIKRKHENNSEQIAQNENDEISQLQSSHQSIDDALLCVTRPYNGQTDAEIAQTTKLIVSQPNINIHAADLAGQTSLIRAARYNLPQTMMVLLQAGAHIEEFRNLQVCSQQHKRSLTDTLVEYKKAHDQNLAEAQSILARFLPVTHTSKKVSELTLVNITLDYLRWPEDYSITIPTTIQVTWQPQAMLRRLAHAKGGGFGSRY